MAREGRKRRTIKRYSAEHLAAVAIATVLSVVAIIFVVQELATRPILVASLGSSAFLLYFQPRNEVNNFKPLVFGHLLAAVTGYGANLLFPEPYLSVASGLAVTVLLLAALRLVHPPAISTSLVFAYRPEQAVAIVTFGLTLAVVVALALIYFFLRHGISATRWATLFHPEEA
ncbi:MAG: HPP family protein [Candidatus Promineifilaceae bacterium]|nr:HPP family protein [Candidatus Promineifilaceae bacterium]